MSQRIHYLDRHLDRRLDEYAAVYDELTLWSARFGLFLLDNVPLLDKGRILDVGTATGFPAIELANLCGSGVEVTAIDIWSPALVRARAKAEFHQLSTVEFLECDIVQLSGYDNHFDLIVSNLGLNNFADPAAALDVCFRVARDGGRIALTTNLTGHMHELYSVFRSVLEREQPDSLEALDEQEKSRGSRETVTDRLQRAGFTIVRVVEEQTTMRFANGAALLNHTLSQFFLGGWRSVMPEKRERHLFDLLERELTSVARARGELRMTVPMLYVEAVARKT